MLKALTHATGHALLTALMLMLVTGCGYHLRGQHNLAPELQNLALMVPANQVDLSRSLVNQLRGSGVNVVESGAEVFSLNILDGEEQQRTVSYTRSVKTAEREIVNTTEFELRAPSGTVVIGPMRIVTERFYLHNPDQLLGEADEQDILRREMREDTANRILTILRRVSSEEIKRRLEEATVQEQAS